jgi:5'(3')-deoxyribonucleotidase
MRRIALDNDGVFADWNSFVRTHIGKEYDHSLWYQLDQVDNLFLQLDILEGSLEMFNQIWDLRHKGYYVFMLTAIPRPTHKLITSVKDKTTWISDKLSPDIDVHTVIGGENKKYWVNKPGDILIDDMPRNIAAWQSHGGVGILHKGDTVETLAELSFVLNK